ncbi:MAG: M23 family metallopeptidase [Gammaproteobacteria bacterium]|nr:M23 family metallopeptidase [Gammaproteobacteria bacterium]MDH3411196.1 M23 family metallopeptidase [Gammaproteobacteria bacterium]
MAVILSARSCLLCFLLTFACASFASELRFDGQFVQGGLITGYTVPGARVTFDERNVRVSGDGVFLIGFGRDAKPESTLEIAFPDGRKTARRLEIAKRNYKIQRIDGLPPRKVTPKPEDMKRIHKEAALIKTARQRDEPRTDFLGGFIWPAMGRISGVYGSQRVLNGVPRRPHFGVDVAAPVGTPVVAPTDGVVTLAQPDMFFSGGTLVIDHGHGLSSSFLHLSEVLVKTGDRIKKGDLIARIGATGRVTGAHLDWRMNLFEARIDPQLLVGEMPEK